MRLSERFSHLGNDLLSSYIFFYKMKLQYFFQIAAPSVSQQLSEVLLSALNQNLVQFTLRPGVQVTVYAAHLSAGKQMQLRVYDWFCQEGPLYFL